MSDEREVSSLFMHGASWDIEQNLATIANGVKVRESKTTRPMLFHPSFRDRTKVLRTSVLSSDTRPMRSGRRKERGNWRKCGRLMRH